VASRQLLGACKYRVTECCSATGRALTCVKAIFSEGSLKLCALESIFSEVNGFTENAEAIFYFQ